MPSDPNPRDEDLTFGAPPEPSSEPSSPASTPRAVELTSAPIVMREHLTELAELLDLTRKRPNRAARAYNTAVAASAKWRAPLLAVLPKAIVTVGAIIVTMTFWPSPLPELPAELLGEWTTTNPDYQDRRLAFTPDAVLIGTTPDGVPLRYSITALKLRTRADTTTLELTYDVDGADAELHAALVGGSERKLVFARPQGLVWVPWSTAMPPQ